MTSTLLSPVPLRKTSAWASYDEVVPLFHAYGTVTVEPIKYRQDGRAWFCGEGPIFGPLTVTVDGSEVLQSNYRFSNATDSAGHTIGLLELPTAPKDSITVKLIGKLDPVDGSVMTNPAVILHDFLYRICGFSVSRAQVDNFRVACNNAGIEFAGVLSDATSTIRSQADELATNAGAVWSIGMPGIAALFPLLTAPATVASFAESDLSIFTQPEPGGDLTSDNIKTALIVDYAWDHVNDKATKSLRLTSAASEKYGEIEDSISLSWIQNANTALSIGQRLLAYRSRPVNEFKFGIDFSRRDISPGQWISVSHPYNATDGSMFVTNAELDPETQEGTVTAVASYGSTPAISIDRVSSQFDPIEQSLIVKFGNGFATITARDEDGAALPGALITLDSVTRRADVRGQAVFQTQPGLHTLRISATGRVDFYTDSYLIAEVA